MDNLFNMAKGIFSKDESAAKEPGFLEANSYMIMGQVQKMADNMKNGDAKNREKVNQLIGTSSHQNGGPSMSR